MDKKQLSEVAKRLFKEDEIENDVTSKILFRDSRINKNEWIRFDLLAKEEGVFAGRDWVEAVAEEVPFKENSLHDSPVEFYQDGQVFKSGTVLFSALAPHGDLLSIERSFLNMLQHLCGVATQTRKFVDLIDLTSKKKNLKTTPKLLHTRKTLPLIRDLQIEAVLAGGALLHRRDLSSRIMLKDNHQQILKKHNLKIDQWIKETWSIEERLSAIVEVDTAAEAIAVASTGVGQLLLDNFKAQQIEELLPMLPEGIKIEVSGGINLLNLPDYVMSGVDFISVGALTHSVKGVDLSLEFRQ
jgi:nicotinate-nucleotide pyrophosphorylase (carboxylating)